MDSKNIESKKTDNTITLGLAMDSDSFDSGSDLTSSSDEELVYKPVYEKLIKDYALALNRNAPMPAQPRSNHWSNLMGSMLDELKRAEKHIKKVEAENERLEKKLKGDREFFRNTPKEIRAHTMRVEKLLRE